MLGCSVFRKVLFCAVLSIFPRLVCADDSSLASLHFCVFGAGGSERARGAMLDESAGSVAECVCSAVFHAQV